MANVTYDPEKFQLTLSRFKKGGNTYEIVVDPDEALAYRDNKHEDLQAVLKSNDIFADAQRGQLAPDSTFLNIFGTDDVDKISKIILVEGELHLTAEYKRGLREKKRKQIIQILHARGCDPRTNLPHPINRIESALEQARVRIDEFESAKAQAKDIVKKLVEVLPIRFEQKELHVQIPASYAAKAYGVLAAAGDLKDSSWNDDGSVSAIIEIPGGLELEVIDQIQKSAHGCAQIETIVKK